MTGNDTPQAPSDSEGQAPEFSALFDLIYDLETAIIDAQASSDVMLRIADAEDLGEQEAPILWLMGEVDRFICEIERRHHILFKALVRARSSTTE